MMVQVLILLVGVLFAYTQLHKKMEQLNFKDDTAENGEKIQVEMNESVSGSEVLSGYTNVALFGINENNSDTIIIASINNDTKEIKLVSLYRDTYLRVAEDENGNGIYNKCNSAYLRGGPVAAVYQLRFGHSELHYCGFCSSFGSSRLFRRSGRRHELRRNCAYQ